MTRQQIADLKREHDPHPDAVLKNRFNEGWNAAIEAVLGLIGDRVIVEREPTGDMKMAGHMHIMSEDQRSSRSGIKPDVQDFASGLYKAMIAASEGDL